MLNLLKIINLLEFVNNHFHFVAVVNAYFYFSFKDSIFGSEVNLVDVYTKFFRDNLSYIVKYSLAVNAVSKNIRKNKAKIKGEK